MSKGIMCPTSPVTREGEPHTIIGCGSSNVAGPDHEGLYDCLDCGIWFNPDHEVFRGREETDR